MGETIDLGRRMELVPMDPHFHNISLALYRQEDGDGPVFQVHSYSNREGARQRVESVARAMRSKFLPSESETSFLYLT